MTDSINTLYSAILDARSKDPLESRTSKLLREGSAKIAKKLAEEAVEVGHEAILKDAGSVVRESADVIYNLCVLWADVGIKPEDVWSEMERRVKLMGIAEKLPKPPSPYRGRKLRGNGISAAAG
ncbi:MAG TPA: phosphoribosyl-ATP diphosphatase [Beijerinckiaceae bacterium]|nr:phosphoribosyl-ATP diphosphatase [Beijerinckiaceae bacterium]